MTLEYEFVENNDAAIYWDDEHITTAKNENPPGITSNGGLPTDPDISESLSDWLSQREIPEELGYSDAIMILARIQSGKIEQR